MVDNTTDVRTADAEYLVELLTVRRDFNHDLPR